LFGLLDVVFTKYAQTSNLSTALAAALTPSSLLTDLLVAYAFYAPRYMRRKLVDAGRAISPLLPDRESEFRRIFSEVAAPRPQLIAWFLFLVALLIAVNAAAILGTGPSPFVFNAGPGSGLEFAASIYDVLSLAVATLALSSVVWTFWSISLGIHRFGGAPLALRPYYEDAFLGLKPLGALSLSLASGYFVFVGLFLVAGRGRRPRPPPPTFSGLEDFSAGSCSSVSCCSSCHCGDSTNGCFIRSIRKPLDSGRSWRRSSRTARDPMPRKMSATCSEWT